eukprot:GGOE01018357.1.p1 GENE.GGOE01018357.1~~GGOE01018357.1.p1  ORF type:complete len:665 (-),score=187.84 GGOE01018357.1:324-2318(-)
MTADAEGKEEERKKDLKKEEKKAGKGRTLSFDERSEKEAQLQRLFELPAPEPLVDDFACAYQKTFLRQGRMYIMQCHLAFYSMLGPRLVLGYGTIQAIREARTLELFNNAIVVTTSDGQTHFFTSFLTRDKALAALSEAHRQHHRANAPQPPASPMSDAGVESDAGSVRVRSSGSSSDDEESVLDSAEEQQAEHGAEAKSKASKHPRRFKATPPSISSVAAIQPNPSMSSVEEALTSLGETGFCPVADLLKKPMKMNVAFPKGAKLEDVYAALLGSGSSFFSAYHQRQGDKVVELQEWREQTLPKGQGVWAGGRQAVFSTEVSMPKRTWVSAYEQHAFCHLQLPEAKVLAFQSATRTPEVMYGDCFRAESLLCWRETCEGDVVLDIYCGLHFVKSTMMRRLIESKALAELSRSYDLWLEVALGMVTDSLACRPVSPVAGAPAEGWMKRREKKGRKGRVSPNPEPSPRCNRPNSALGDPEGRAAAAAGTTAPAGGHPSALVLVSLGLVLQWLVVQYIGSEGAAAHQLIEATEQHRLLLQNQTSALQSELRRRRKWTVTAASLVHAGVLPGDEAAMSADEPVDTAALQRTVRAAINVLAPCDGRDPLAPPPDPDPHTSEALLLLLTRQQQQLTLALLTVMAGGVLGVWTLLALASYAVYKYRHQQT